MRWSLSAATLMLLVPACSSPYLEGLALRAFGNEPFWNVTIADSLVYGRLGEEDILVSERRIRLRGRRFRRCFRPAARPHR